MQIPIKRLADALEAINRDSDRYPSADVPAQTPDRLTDASSATRALGLRWRDRLVVDLRGRATTFLEHRDVNLAVACRPDAVEPESVRKLLLGALRFGKPFVLDLLSVELAVATVDDLLEPVLPGLLQLLLSKRILLEEHYAQLLRPTDGPEYDLRMWTERNLEFFQFVLLSTLPQPPEWCTSSFFVVKCA